MLKCCHTFLLALCNPLSSTNKQTSTDPAAESFLKQLLAELTKVSSFYVEQAQMLEVSSSDAAGLWCLFAGLFDSKQHTWSRQLRQANLLGVECGLQLLITNPLSLSPALSSPSTTGCAGPADVLQQP